MLLPPRDMAAIAATALAVGSAFAGDKNPTHVSIGGTVIGANGKPLGDAEIHALRVDTKGPVAIAMTNTRGLYLLKSLPAGAYMLTAYVDGLALSRANIQTRGVAWAKVDFDLRLETVDGMNRTDPNFRNFIPNTNPH